MPVRAQACQAGNLRKVGIMRCGKKSFFKSFMPYIKTTSFSKNLKLTKIAHKIFASIFYHKKSADF